MAGPTEVQTDVIVIGAGIVGLSTAFLLQRRGFSVLLIDRKGPAAEATRGNAGAFAFSEIVPLATPGIIARAPRWLLDPMGPLAIPPAYAWKLAPWMLRFWRASRPEAVDRSMRAQAALMDHSKRALLPFLRQTATGDMLRRDGNLQVYESRTEFEAARPYWEARKQFGISFEHIHGSQAIAEVQPGLDRRFVSATFTPEWYSIADPYEYALTIADIFQNRRGMLKIAEALELSPRPGIVSVKCSDGQTVVAEKVVVCAGAWSHRLAASAGDRVPLETERGYNTTLPSPEIDLRTQVTFGGHGFVLSKINDAVRVGGAVELGGLDRPPDFRRADALLTKAKSFMPHLNTSGGKRWMGFRPSLPDSLPVIGTSSVTPHIVYAFGHGHLGLTQSAGTAELVCEIVTGEKPSIDLAPFRADRF